MKIYPTENRLQIKVIDPRKDRTEGGLWIPHKAQVDPKVFEAEVLAIGPDVPLGFGAVEFCVGDRIMAPNRVLGDALPDGTVFVRYTEIFCKVVDSKLIDVTPSILVPA